MFERNALAHLKEWSERPGHKPLVLRGARQVGKTTLVNQFAKGYGMYLKLNLEKSEDRQLFERDMSMEDLVSAIYLINNKQRKNVPTLLFIDEIQHSPQAVAMLRYFYEECPGIDVIAAGSLLESLIDRHISFPVGRVEYMAVRPCSFNEFLGAVGEGELKDAQRGISIPTPLHGKIMRLFNTYTLIGGMPEVVADYAGNKDIVSLKHIYETLLTGYRDDVEKYADTESTRNTIRHILNNGWIYAGQRIAFEKFGNSLYRSREMSEAFRTLEKTMLLELAYPVTSAVVPLAPEPKRSPKLLWLDTGIVNYVGGFQREFVNIQNMSDVWTGHIGEQIVGQELLSNDNLFSHRRYFWVNGTGSEAEVDFVVQFGDKVIPIEVKSGHNTRLRSLHLFMDKAPHDIAVRFWGNPLSIDNVTTAKGKCFRLFNLPYYYAGQVTNFLQSTL
ncbi:MAG: AAA family ATPase [Bacteroidales bacterium]|nr:AAA family ATPase [Bacteroidales bacterium]